MSVTCTSGIVAISCFFLLGRVLLISKMYAAGTVAISCVKDKEFINGLSSSGKCGVY